MQLPDAIKTDRLLIRPFTAEDQEAFVQFMTNDEATRYLLFADEQKTVAGARSLFRIVVQSYKTTHPIFAYAIALKEHGFIGSCGIGELPLDAVYECYYSLLPDYWRHGYASEAMRALLAYCFAHYPITEIRAYISPDNPASSNLAARIGMTYKGIQKHPTFGNSSRMYAIMRP